MAAGKGGGVKVVEIRDDQAPPKMIYNPGHPDANADGYVAMPNVQVVTEMADLISATRAYEANINAMKTSRQIITDALNLLK